MLGVVGQQCCVRLHGSKSLTGFKLYATSANTVVVPCKQTQQVTTLLGPTMLGVVGPTMLGPFHGPLESFVIDSFIESRSVRDQFILAQVVWVSRYWSEEFLFIKCLFCSQMKTEKPVYTAICILYYIMAHLLLQKNTERDLFRHKLVAFLPIVYFTRRNCSLKNVIFLDAYLYIKYYSNTIDLTMYELYIFLA